MARPSRLPDRGTKMLRVLASSRSRALAISPALPMTWDDALRDRDPAGSLSVRADVRAGDFLRIRPHARRGSAAALAGDVVQDLHVVALFIACALGLSLGGLGRSRTCDLRFRKAPLYPVELRGQLRFADREELGVDGRSACSARRTRFRNRAKLGDPAGPLASTAACRRGTA